VLNSDKLCLRIIQLTHDNVINDHSERAKSYELISWVYWWSKIYKYIQCFIWNCHMCTCFKLFRQWTQEWLCFLSVFERCWCDVFMNYVNSLSLSIFMNITYRYVLVFVDHFIKMRHLVFITFMKVEETINYFYAHVWKHHDLLEFFMSDRDTQFIFNIWKHMCKMLKINVKLSTTYHFEIDDEIERINAVMKHYLWVFINYMQNDWAIVVFKSLIQFSNFSEFDEKNSQISLKFDANRANILTLSKHFQASFLKLSWYVKSVSFLRICQESHQN
jgi:hypothetical protein